MENIVVDYEITNKKQNRWQEIVVKKACLRESMAGENRRKSFMNPSLSEVLNEVGIFGDSVTIS